MHICMKNVRVETLLLNIWSYSVEQQQHIWWMFEQYRVPHRNIWFFINNYRWLPYFILPIKFPFTILKQTAKNLVSRNKISLQCSKLHRYEQETHIVQRWNSYWFEIKLFTLYRSVTLEIHIFNARPFCKLLNYLYVPCKSATIFWHQVHPLMCPQNRQLKNDPFQPGEIKYRLIILYILKKKEPEKNYIVIHLWPQQW
jgi:hypothetical protein